MIRRRACFLVCSSILLLFLEFSVFSIVTFAANLSRTALVIGNGSYTTAPLKNPVNDARDIAAVLKNQGFTVIHKENADRSKMRSAIRDFEELLAKNGGTGLFYFAGHGVQLHGQNYLVPIGADIQREYEVPDETILADLVLKAMAYANNELNIVILDACRNNPFPRSFRSASRGLARMKTMGSGMLIAYATSPGSVASDGDGKNGIYTKYLLKAMETPGLSIEQVFKSVRQNVMQETNQNQTPWEESSLTGDFYFIATDNAGITVNQPSHGIHLSAGKKDENELMLWQGISNSRNIGDYEEYLHLYPDGVFAELARDRIESFAETSTASGKMEKSVEAVSGSEFAAKLYGSWKLDYVENSKKNYLMFTFLPEGRGGAEGDEPDGTWWAEPVTWSLDNKELTLLYEEGAEKYMIKEVYKENLILLGIQGDNTGERFAMNKVQANGQQVILQDHDQVLVGTWKDSWEEDGQDAYQVLTLSKDGSSQDQGKTPGYTWTDRGRWQVENRNVLTIITDGNVQRYRVIHVTPEYLDITDLSPEYMGVGSRLKRIDRKK